jgi:arylsulfatase A-like enzyme
VHYQDPHGPYLPPEPGRARFLERELLAPEGRRILPESRNQSGFGAIPHYQYVEGQNQPAFYRAGYDGEIAFVDQEIEQLLEGLTARGHREDSVLVFAADHGESLGENDLWFAHGEQLSEPLVRIPLFLSFAGRPPGQRNDVVSLLDVFPTLATLLGGPAPPGLPGRDILSREAPQQESSVYLSGLSVSPVHRYGLIERGHRYLVSVRASETREQVFRIGDETRDLAGERAVLVEVMRAHLAATRSRFRAASGIRQEMSPEDLERLRALGYVDGK